MKRLNSSDSLGALFSMCPSSDDHSPTARNNIYSRDYQCMLDGLDEDGCIEESGHVPEKKRRLSVDQVKALERNFEVENKLEPERKVKLAQELGLQPRQVAVWFQNRRARWKTKQLERDYGVLKSSFDTLKLNYESLQQDKDALLKEIKELKAKLNSESNKSIIKEEISVFESDHINEIDIEPITPPESMSDGSENAKLIKVKNVFAEFKDGSSDSDSSEIFQTQQLIMSPNSSSPPSSINGLSFSDSRSDGLGTTQKIFDHPHFVKIEEHNFFSGEEACNFFSEEQAPSLPWYCPDQWS